MQTRLNRYKNLLPIYNKRESLWLELAEHYNSFFNEHYNGPGYTDITRLRKQLGISND